MSDLSFIEKVLDGVDVEWMALGDVGEFIRGNGMQKKDFSNEGFPAIHYGQIFTRYGLSADKAFTYVPEQLAKKLKKAHKNDLLLATTSENDKDVVKPLAWLGEETAISGDMMLFRHSQNVKYLAYYFQTTAFQTQKKKYISGAKVRRVSKDSLARMLVPIPSPKDPVRSLEIQTEIVRILDVFSTRTNELLEEISNELAARIKQLTHYKNKLLNFSENEVQWKSLGDACEYVDYRGKTPPKTTDGIFLVTAKNIRRGYIDYSSSQEFISPKDYDLVMRRGIPKIGDVLITTEAPCGFVAQVDKEGIALAQRVIKYRSKTAELNNSFLKHYLLCEHFQAKLSRAATGSTVKGIKGSSLHKLTVPMPSPQQQERMIPTLDKLDMLVHSIAKALPCEMKLRRQQYEYYRDALLSFPKYEEVEV